MERPAYLTEAGRRIWRPSKPKPDLDADNDAPSVSDGASGVLRYKKYYPICRINSDRVKNKTFIIGLQCVEIKKIAFL